MIERLKLRTNHNANGSQPAIEAAHNVTEAGKADQTLLAEHAEAIRRLAKRVAKDIISIGQHLTEAKRMLGHGGWLPWLEHEFGWNERTAQRFITVFDMAGKYDKLSDLMLPASALYMLAAPSTSDQAREQIIRRAQQGKRLGVAEVKKAIAKEQPDSTSKTSAEPKVAEDHAEPHAAPASSCIASPPTPHTPQLLSSCTAPQTSKGCRLLAVLHDFALEFIDRSPQELLRPMTPQMRHDIQILSSKIMPWLHQFVVPQNNDGGAQNTAGGIGAPATELTGGNTPRDDDDAS